MSFPLLYDTELKNVVEMIEVKRKEMIAYKKKAMIWQCALVGIILSPFIILGLGIVQELSFKIGLVGVAGFALLMAIDYTVRYQHYLHSYKEEIQCILEEKVMNKIVKNINHNLNYNKSGMISSVDIYESGLLENFEKYESKDYVSGNTNGLSVETCEICTEGKESSLNGRFISIELQEECNQKMKIFMKDNPLAEKQNAMKKVTVQNEAFSEKFAIYIPREGISQNLLSNCFIEKIVKYQNENDKEISVSIIGKRMYIFIKDEKNINIKKFKDGKDMIMPNSYDIYKEFHDYIEEISILVKMLSQSSI